MIDIDKSSERIQEFVQSSIVRFSNEKAKPTSIGIYCCPWAGWITTNFNITKKIDGINNNCLDFEHVEFDILELCEWESEYEKDVPEFKLNGVVKEHNHDLGDEWLHRFDLCQ